MLGSRESALELLLTAAACEPHPAAVSEQEPGSEVKGFGDVPLAPCAAALRVARHHLRPLPRPLDDAARVCPQSCCQRYFITEIMAGATKGLRLKKEPIFSSNIIAHVAYIVTLVSKHRRQIERNAAAWGAAIGALNGARFTCHRYPCVWL